MKFIDRLNVERDEAWDVWLNKIPIFKFPSRWTVQLIPPFGGAMVRFGVVLPDGRKKSIYLDCFDRLGFYDGHPYWEVYPVNNDAGRCGIDDVEELFKLIKAK